MDRCWRGEFWYDGLFEHRNPDCNKKDHYAEFRKCYMGGIKERLIGIDNFYHIKYIIFFDLTKIRVLRIPASRMKPLAMIKNVSAATKVTRLRV